MCRPDVRHSRGWNLSYRLTVNDSGQGTGANREVQRKVGAVHTAGEKRVEGGEEHEDDLLYQLLHPLRICRVTARGSTVATVAITYTSALQVLGESDKLGLPRNSLGSGHMGAVPPAHAVGLREEESPDRTGELKAALSVHCTFTTYKQTRTGTIR